MGSPRTRISSSSDDGRSTTSVKGPLTSRASSMGFSRFSLLASCVALGFCYNARPLRIAFFATAPPEATISTAPSRAIVDVAPRALFVVAPRWTTFEPVALLFAPS